MPRRKTLFTFTSWTTRLSKVPPSWLLVMIPLRASMSTPPTTTPEVKLGLSPLTASPVIVTLADSTRKTLLAAPPHSDEPAHGLGAETAGRTLVVAAPAPLIVTALFTTTFSVYVPAARCT